MKSSLSNDQAMLPLDDKREDAVQAGGELIRFEDAVAYYEQCQREEALRRILSSDE